MKEHEYFEIHARICKTLAHPVRLRIINALQIGEKSVNELSSELHISHGTVSRHLNQMRPWGVLVARRDGQNTYYRIENPKIITAYGIMHEFAIEFLKSKGELLQVINA